MQGNHAKPTMSGYGGGSMSFFAWSESICVGIPLLDDDHEIIIRLNMRLQDCLERQEDLATLAEICERLIAYNEVHFAREDMIMVACAYPDLKSHREDHSEFIQGLYAFMNRYTANPDRIVLREFLAYLREWVEQHVLIEDVRMGTYAARHRRSQEVAEAVSPLISSNLS